MKRCIKKGIFTSFAIISGIAYIYILYYMLFRGFGRENIIMSESMQKAYSYNLIPFKTILDYIMLIANGNMIGSATWNLIGNLFLLFPLGFYLPFFVHKLIKFKWFILVTAVLIIAVEVMQAVTMTGSCDIDDFILNFMGAVMGLLVFKYTVLRRLLWYRVY